MESVGEMAEKLKSLAQLNIDAVHAYQQAIEAISESEIRDQMSRFRDEHNRHVAELSILIRECGETPPAYSSTSKGFVIAQFTAVRNVGGTESALQIMKTNVEWISRVYDQARAWDLAPAADAMVERNFRDEKRQLQYLEQALEDRVWEKYARFRTQDEVFREENRGRMGPTASGG
jgi:rubrerythrin